LTGATSWFRIDSMAKRTEYNEEVGMIRASLFVGTFDEVIDNLKGLCDRLQENVGLGDGEDFFLDFSPFLGDDVDADLIVYRRGWIEVTEDENH
jgi:hypothetical protein